MNGEVQLKMLTQDRWDEASKMMVINKEIAEFRFKVWHVLISEIWLLIRKKKVLIKIKINVI